MMTSDEWTRAVFLREPKERVLSAFLDKFVKSNYFNRRCCINKRSLSPQQKEECSSKTQVEDEDHEETDLDFGYFLQRTRDCHDQHWNPQRHKIDEKWWPYITFVGYMNMHNNLETDAKRLLQSLKSSKDGLTAWEKYAKTGWGENSQDSFLHKDVALHATNARDKLRKYYSRCDEAIVEKHWSKDWESPFFHFDEVKLYNETESSTGEYDSNCRL